MKTTTATPNMHHQVPRSVLFAFAMMITALVPTKVEAAACTWVAAGVPTDQNFSGPLNWDDPPSPAADLFFAAGSAFVAKGSPVNDLVGLDLNAIYLYEAYNITGNSVNCQIIKSYNATVSTVSLPVATAGTAVLTVTVDTDGATLFLRGRLSGTGPVTYAGPGIKRLSGTINNTLSGLHSVALGNLVLDSTASESVAGPMVIDSGAIVTLMAAPEIKNTMPVTVDGHFDLSGATGDEGVDTETIGGLLGTGTINLGASILGCTAQPSPTIFAGGFAGIGGFRQSVSGIQVLSGTSTHTGATSLAGGELHIRGSQPASPVQVTAGTLVLANDCLVGDVTLSGGSDSTLTCYDTLSAVNLHGTATSLTIGSGSRFLVVTRGASATQYAHLTTAAVAITGATLIVDTATYTPAVAAEMTIIDNTGSGAVTGTFAGLSEGALVVSSTDPATTFAISYIGGTGNDVTLTCLALDTTAPVISTIASGSLTATSASVTWTTNEASSSQVQYGLTAAYGSATTINASLVLSHGVPVTGLVANTLYHFRVLSRDASGNLATSTDRTFSTTATADTTAPVISAVSAGSLTIGSASVTWTTNEPGDSQIQYGLTTAYGSTTTLDAGLTLSHNVPVTGLTASTVYHFRVLSRDAAGNLATGADGTFTTSATADTTAPVISVISAGNLTASSATVTWTTDETSNSKVEYGLTAAYGSATTINASQVLSHSVPVTGLVMGTLYHFRVLSRDAAANLATSADGTFTTTVTADTTAPVITVISVGSLAASSAAVTWTTDEASDSQVAYGLTTAYGSTTTINASQVLSHGVPVTSLVAGTVYHFRVLSRDAAGNLATSADGTFTTTTMDDTTAPAITAVSAGDLTANSASVIWTTDEVSNSQVEYGLTAAYGSTTTTDESLILSHGAPVTGLTADTIYHFRVLSADAAGNVATSADGTFTTASAISSNGGGDDDDDHGCGLGGAFALLGMALILSMRLCAFKTGRRG